MAQSVSFTYTPLNATAVTIGDSDALPLISWDVELSYTNFRFMAVFRVIGQGSSDSARADSVETQLRVLDRLKHWSGDFVLTDGTEDLYTIDESDRATAYRARTSLTAVDDPADHRFRRTFLFTLSAIRAADATEDDNGRRNATITVTQDATSKKVVTMVGTYTGITTTDAEANFNTDVGGGTLRHESWAASVLTDIGGDYELISREYSYDDEKAILNFQLVYLERIFKQSEALADVPGIKDQRLTISRRSDWRFGTARQKNLSRVEVNYVAAIDKDVIAPEDIYSTYRSTIKLLLVTQASERFTGQAVILMNEQVTPSLDGSGLSVFMELLVVDGTSDLLGFQLTVEYGLSLQKDVRNRWSGVLHDYTTFTPGPRIVGKVTVVEVALGFGTASTSALGLVVADATFGVADNGPRLLIPGIPPFPDNLTQPAAGNKWILLEGGLSFNPENWGEDDDLFGLETTVSTTVLSATWLWGKETRDNIVPKNGGPGSPTPASGSTTERVRSNLFDSEGNQRVSNGDGTFRRVGGPDFFNQRQQNAAQRLLGGA